jgi:methyl-accepting chemotaxis protein
MVRSSIEMPSEAGPSHGSEEDPGTGVEAELARYLPHLGRLGTQLRQTSAQIEESVVEVCRNFDGIAERARATVRRTTGFLGREGNAAEGKRSFDGLLQVCGSTMLNIMNASAEAGEISLRAVERIAEMDKASQQISVALRQLDDIAKGNKILALNARIEAAHCGDQGAGFAAVAVELASQTAKSRSVTSQVGDLVGNLRDLAQRTLDDLRRMHDRDRQRGQQCKREVDQALQDLHIAHVEMKEMLNAMTEDGALLASDIGSAIRGLQFQDRTSQRIAHVVEDLDTLRERLTARFGTFSVPAAADEGFSAYTMHEERQVAGLRGEEASAGEVELF